METSEIDLVLVYKEGSEQKNQEPLQNERIIFENNLSKEGLVLETSKLTKSDLYFVKIHAPLDVLKLYADVLQLKLPIKNYPELEKLNKTFINSKPNGFMERIKKYFRISTAKDYHIPKFCSTYNKEKEFLFDIKDSNCFSSSLRTRIVYYILKRTQFSENIQDFGIEKLMNQNTFNAIFPLHDGKIDEPGTLRNYLYRKWASLAIIHKFQPLDEIKDYLGVKVGLYFAWLGFYIKFLILASIVGVFTFIYGLSTLGSNTIASDICNFNSSIPMCPLCNKHCDFWSLKDICFYAKFLQLFDHDGTVFFSVFMSFWTVLFLEFWKRYAAELNYKWDLDNKDFIEEPPRPDYLKKLKNVRRQKLNLVTNLEEPYVSFWKKKLPNTIFSLSMILLMITMAISAVVGVIIYRISIKVILINSWDDDDPSVHSWGLMLVTISAVVLNLGFIIFFNFIYSYVALYLTELELQRTQSEFDESLNLKLYLLNAVNFYSSIFYIAFFKGRFAGVPGKYNYIFGFRQEDCGGSGSCMAELCIQLSIIMIGKQTLNALMENLLPELKKLWKKVKSENLCSETDEQWTRDYSLLEWDSRSLFPEYLEMIIQFGFITIFVAAFPLAPLFALINNIFELRLDARKMLTCHRRPISDGLDSGNIGVWFSILDFLGKISVISNGCIIAFTTTFIPKLIYRLENNGSLDGFLKFTLHTFNTSGFEPGTLPAKQNWNSTSLCYFNSYETSSTVEPYKLNFYWKVLFARLVFIIIFQNFVSFSMTFIEWVVPDIPKDLATRMKQENYFINEKIIRQESQHNPNLESEIANENDDKI